VIEGLAEVEMSLGISGIPSEDVPPVGDFVVVRSFFDRIQ
jgi:hypothetical protein